jgi:hypothetical protein
MNKYLRNIILKHWQIGLLLIVILIIGLPSLWVNWMIVDDGYYLLVEQKISILLSQGNFSGLGQIVNEQAGGRFRPMLWIYLWFTYLIGGFNPVIHHFLSFLISGLTVVIIYKIITIITKNKTSGLIGGLFFVLASFNLENWYRLKTPEPKITFFIAVSVFFIISTLKKIYDEKKGVKLYLLFSILPLFFAYFIRETSFAFLPFSLFLLFGVFLFKKNDSRYRLWIKYIRPYLLINLILALIIFTINYLFKQQGTYTTNYELNPSKMFDIGILYFKLIAKDFGLIFWLLGFSSIISLIRLIKSKRFSFLIFIQYSFLTSFVSFFITILPWGIPLGRYLEMVLLFLSLFLGIEVFNLLSYLPKKWKFKVIKTKKNFIIDLRNLFWIIFLLGFIGICINNFSGAYNYIRDTIYGQKNINIILKDISLESPPGSAIYWNLKENEGMVEIIMQCNILLNIVYNRPDLKIVYLNNMSPKNFHFGDMIISAIVYDRDYFMTDEELLSNYKKAKLIMTLPHEVKRISLNTPSIMRIIHLIVLGKPILERPLYSESIYQNQWKIYQLD